MDLMNTGTENQFCWWMKYTLTIEEASIYFGIGQTTLRRFLKDHLDEDFIIQNGTKILIKKHLFEKYVDEKLTAL